jgi:hypothetical protein
MHMLPLGSPPLLDEAPVELLDEEPLDGMHVPPTHA